MINIILDFDGTLTDVFEEAEPFEKEYYKLFKKEFQIIEEAEKGFRKISIQIENKGTIDYEKKYHNTNDKSYFAKNYNEILKHLKKIK